MLKTSHELHEGKALRVSRMGTGPPVLCLHGYPDNLQIWSEVAPVLASSHEIIAFDWPGMGYSEPWPGGATPEHMAERLLILVNRWKLGRVSILAIDMGGQPALVFAAKYSERTASLTVMNSLVMPETRTSWEITLLRKFGWNRFLFRQLPQAIFKRALHTFLPKGFAISPELRADLWNAFRQPEVRSFVSKMCAGYQGKLPLLPKFYPQIKAPTLILWAADDGHFPPAHAEQLHQQIEHSEMRILAGARHWMPLYRGQEIAALVKGFLARSVHSP